MATIPDPHGKLRYPGPAPPYVPFVPLEGLEADLFFDDEESNEALVELRRFVIGFVEEREPDTPQIWQWEPNIEL